LGWLWGDAGVNLLGTVEAEMQAFDRCLTVTISTVSVGVRWPMSRRPLGRGVEKFHKGFFSPCPVTVPNVNHFGDGDVFDCVDLTWNYPFAFPPDIADPNMSQHSNLELPTALYQKI
jgi:hypothetical protein